MSLLFFPRRLDEIGFEASGELRESAADRNLCRPETPIYKQLKIRFTIYVHLKVLHDTPPLRGFQLHVSRVLELRVSRPSNLVFHKPGFVHFWARFPPDGPLV
jgi:hypothetical protein